MDLIPVLTVAGLGLLYFYLWRGQGSQPQSQKTSTTGLPVLDGLLTSQKEGELSTHNEIPLDAPRGIRNNNPGNIRYTGALWLGLSRVRADDEGFCIFIDVRYGIRAMAKILKAYRGRGIVTVDQIIRTWAPESENDSASYVYSVANRSGLPVHLPVYEGDYPRLIEAMIYHENGIQPYTMDTIRDGVARSD